MAKYKLILASLILSGCSTIQEPLSITTDEPVLDTTSVESINDEEASVTAWLPESTPNFDGTDESLTEAKSAWKLRCVWNGKYLELRTWNNTNKAYQCQAKCSYPGGSTFFKGTNPARVSNFVMGRVTRSRTGNLKISNYSCRR
ncbi:MAG: hypothetical protein AAFN91_10355 [Pseudomonadota bacterium]